MRTKLLMIVLFVSIAIFCSGCKPDATGPDSPGPDKTPASEMPSGPVGERMINTGGLGKALVEVKGAYLAEDYKSRPAIVITYSWINQTDEPISAMVSVLESAKQGDAKLESALLMSMPGYEPNNGMQDIQPGESIDVQSAFLLNNQTDNVVIELTEFDGETGDIVAAEFDLAAMQAD